MSLNVKNGCLVLLWISRPLRCGLLIRQIINSLYLDSGIYLNNGVIVGLCLCMENVYIISSCMSEDCASPSSLYFLCVFLCYMGDVSNSFLVLVFIAYGNCSLP